MIPEAGDSRGAALTRSHALEIQSPQEAAAAQQILEANRNKNFVQRILNAGDWPVMQNPDGGYSSHRMGSAEVDGKSIVFPTLVYDPSTNALRQPADPVAEAIKTGEYIEFQNPITADRFASDRYKVGLNTGLMQQMRQPQPSPMDAAMSRFLQ